jgi:hypothetical protein
VPRNVTELDEGRDFKTAQCVEHQKTYSQAELFDRRQGNPLFSIHGGSFSFFPGIVNGKQRISGHLSKKNEGALKCPL